MSTWGVIRGTPLLGLLALAYILIAMVTPESIEASLFTIMLPSDTDWPMTLGQFLVAIGLLALYLEILKATRTTNASVVDHLLSTAVFIACLLLFLLVPRLGTTTFFLITFMALIDLVAGFTVTITAARRDFGVSPEAFD